MIPLSTWFALRSLAGLLRCALWRRSRFCLPTSRARRLCSGGWGRACTRGSWPTTTRSSGRGWPRTAAGKSIRRGTRSSPCSPRRRRAWRRCWRCSRPWQAHPWPARGAGPGADGGAYRAGVGNGHGPGGPGCAPGGPGGGRRSRGPGAGVAGVGGAGAVRSLPPGAALADLGVHRLKDLEHPVRIFQLRAAGLPGGVPAAAHGAGRSGGGYPDAAPRPGLVHRAAAGAGRAGRCGGGCGRGGGHSRDRGDGRGGQDRVRGARRAPAGAAVPGRADLLAAARAHPRAAAGRPGRRAGQPAADRRGPGRRRSRRGWRRGWRCGGTGWPRQQLLLILDDAAGSEQVRPLLPGAGGSLVLVTSRRHLSALEDATAISLDTLPPEEAAGLLVRLAARPGLEPERPGGEPRSPGCAGTCRWPSGWWPASCTTTRPGRRPGGPPSWPRRWTGWS